VNLAWLFSGRADLSFPNFEPGRLLEDIDQGLGAKIPVSPVDFGPFDSGDGVP